MKITKYLLLPLCLSVTASVFAGEWTEKLSVESVSDFYDAKAYQQGAEVTFKTAPVTGICQTESKSAGFTQDIESTYVEYEKC